MTTVEFISALFCRVDAALHDVPTHPQATLYPSEVVTVALLFALKGDGERAVSRWLERDYRPLFPQLPERPRLFRLFRLFRLCAAPQGWTARFLAPPTVLGVAESDGIALLHPYRAKRHPLPDRLGRKRHPLPDRLGRKGLSNHRWIVGGELAVVLNQGGLVCAWAADTANGPDSAFPPLIGRFAEGMIIPADGHLADGHLADGHVARKDDNPPNLKVCPHGTWNGRMLVATTCSLLPLIRPLKKAIHRVWRSGTMRLAFSVALFNVLVQWDGLPLMSTAAPIVPSPRSACDFMPLAPQVIYPVDYFESWWLESVPEATALARLAREGDQWLAEHRVPDPHAAELIPWSIRGPERLRADIRAVREMLRIAEGASPRS